jgi:hypothetical protein
MADTVECVQTQGHVACSDCDILVELNSSRPTDNGPSVPLDAGVRSIAALAAEICGECVPRNHARALKDSMNQIQELARRIA